MYTGIPTYPAVLDYIIQHYTDA